MFQIIESRQQAHHALAQAQGLPEAFVARGSDDVVVSGNAKRPDFSMRSLLNLPQSGLQIDCRQRWLTHEKVAVVLAPSTVLELSLGQSEQCVDTARERVQNASNDQAIGDSLERRAYCRCSAGHLRERQPELEFSVEVSREFVQANGVFDVHDDLISLSRFDGAHQFSSGVGGPASAQEASASDQESGVSIQALAPAYHADLVFAVVPCSASLLVDCCGSGSAQPSTEVDLHSSAVARMGSLLLTAVLALTGCACAPSPSLEIAMGANVTPYLRNGRTGGFDGGVETVRFTFREDFSPRYFGALTHRSHLLRGRPFNHHHEDFYDVVEIGVRFGGGR